MSSTAIPLASTGGTHSAAASDGSAVAAQAATVTKKLNAIITATADNMDSKEETVLSKSLLSDVAILEHMKRGTVVIKPFSMDNLSTTR
jgi:hypothetical protein